MYLFSIGALRKVSGDKTTDGRNKDKKQYSLGEGIDEEGAARSFHG